MENFFETRMRVDASRINLKFRLSIAGILELMEDAQTIHTDEMHVDAPTFKKNDNAFWVITRTFLHINRLPGWEEPVVVGTYPLKPMAIRSERQNYIKDLDGNILISGKNEWCALDGDTRKLRPMSTLKSYPHDMVHKTEKIYTSFPTVKDIQLSDDDLIYEQIMRTSYLDFNHHVNNVKYAYLIVDCFPSSFWESCEITDIRIDYINECKESEKMQMYAKKEDNVIKFCGKTAEKTIFTAMIIVK